MNISSNSKINPYAIASYKQANQFTNLSTRKESIDKNLKPVQISGQNTYKHPRDNSVSLTDPIIGTKLDVKL